MQHFQPNKTIRFEATNDTIAPSTTSVLASLGLVDAPTEAAFDRFTRLVTLVLKVPVALVSFVEEDKDRQYFKSQVGLKGKWAKERCTPLTHSFCQYVKRDNRPLIVENAPNDARVCGNLAIPELGVKAYLGVPVHGLDGAALGALCAIDSEPRTWLDFDLAVMVEIAGCVSAQVRLRHTLQLATTC